MSGTGILSVALAGTPLRIDQSAQIIEAIGGE
jgi:hypothetical protein